MRVRYSSKLWYGLVAYLASVGGTVLLASELDRPWAVLLLISAAVLAVIVWGRQEWIPAFPRYPVTRVTFFKAQQLYPLVRVAKCVPGRAGMRPSLPRRSKGNFWASRSSMAREHRLFAVV